MNALQEMLKQAGKMQKAIRSLDREVIKIEFANQSIICLIQHKFLLANYESVEIKLVSGGHFPIKLSKKSDGIEFTSYVSAGEVNDIKKYVSAEQIELLKSQLDQNKQATVTTRGGE